MYAVIKTGGKQYRVSPGDLLVVEKLDGAPGADVAFDQVLMLGDGGEVTVGAPLVDGAVVRATLIETRKGEKVKVFKKIRRQGYRRTKGHRQIESVLRVVGLEGGGKSSTWDGQVDLTPRAVLVARSRGLAPVVDHLTAAEGAFSEQPISETPAQAPQGIVDPQAQSQAEGGVGAQVGTETADGAAKKTRARKPKAEAAAPLPDPEAAGFVDQQTEETLAEQAEGSDQR